MKKNLKIATLVLLFTINNLNSQTGNWDLDPSNGIVKTTTIRDVGIGTNAPEGKAEIKYCQLPPQNGLIITLTDCNLVGTTGTNEGGSGGSYSGNGVSNPGDPLPTVNFTSINFSPVYQVTTQLVPLINSSMNPLFWIRQEDPSNSINNPNPYSKYYTNFIVQPDGLVGINTANPRAVLDVVSTKLAANDQPTAIFSMFVPGQIMNNNGQTGKKTTQIMINNKLKAGQYNGIVQQNDQAILFSDGLSTNVEGGNLSGALVIAPHASNSNVGGLRMDANGNIELRGELKVHNNLSVNTKWWPDYVFSPSYKLSNLDTLKAYIEVNKHLPSFPNEETL